MARHREAMDRSGAAFRSPPVNAVAIGAALHPATVEHQELNAFILRGERESAGLSCITQIAETSRCKRFTEGNRSAGNKWCQFIFSSRK